MEKQNKKVNPRGRSFEGKIIKKFHDRIVIELDRFLYLKKYERYEKRKTRLHAKINEEQYKELELGDRVRIKECKPLSKMIHFVFVTKLKGAKQ